MTNPWWLNLGALCGGTRSYDMILRQLVMIERFEAEAIRNENQAGVSYFREQRRHAVLDFLENPGYADESRLRHLQSVAADVLTEPALEKFLAGRWQQHLAVLWVETILHITSIVVTALDCAIVFGGLLPMLPAALTASVGLLWLALMYVELIWSGSLSGTARRMFVPQQAVGGITQHEQLRLVVRGLRFWRRPVAWLFVFLLTRPHTASRLQPNR